MIGRIRMVEKYGDSEGFIKIRRAPADVANALVDEFLKEVDEILSEDE